MTSTSKHRAAQAALTLLCLTLTAPVSAWANNELSREHAAETEAAPDFAVTVEPFHLRLGTFAFGVERRLSNRWSVVGLLAGSGSASRSRTTGSVEGVAEVFDHSSQHLEARLEPGLRYYLTGSAPVGLWTGLHALLGYGQWHFRSNAVESRFFAGTMENDLTRLELGAGLRLGYTQRLYRGLVAQLGVALDGVQARSRGQSRSASPDREPVV